MFISLSCVFSILSQGMCACVSRLKYSASSDLDYPNAKFHKPHALTLQKPLGSWQLRNLAKWCFLIVKSNVECCKCIDYQREAGSMQEHGYRNYRTPVLAMVCFSSPKIQSHGTIQLIIEQLDFQFPQKI